MHCGEGPGSLSLSKGGEGEGALVWSTSADSWVGATQMLHCFRLWYFFNSLVNFAIIDCQHETPLRKLNCKTLSKWDFDIYNCSEVIVTSTSNSWKLEFSKSSKLLWRQDVSWVNLKFAVVNAGRGIDDWCHVLTHTHRVWRGQRIWLMTFCSYEGVFDLENWYSFWLIKGIQWYW